MNKQKAFAEAQTQYHMGSSKQISMEYEHNTESMQAFILYQCWCSWFTNSSSMCEGDRASNLLSSFKQKFKAISMNPGKTHQWKWEEIWLIILNFKFVFEDMNNTF